MAIGISMIAMAGGCGKKGAADDLDKVEETVTPTGAATEELPEIEDYVASDYMTLGKYKGVEVTVEKLEVTTEDIEQRIQEVLASDPIKTEITDRPVQEGDTVNIDYEGLLDGEAFEGGTDQGHELVIGSNSFIEGFEEGLIGANAGDKLALDLTFPEEYSNSSELAGKAVVFNVTVNSIIESVTPELTEEYVKENTDSDTIEAYKESIRKELEEANRQEMDTEKENKIFTAVFEGSTFTSVPDTLINYYTAYYTNYLNYQLEQYAAMYGVDTQTYMDNIGYTQEKMDSDITTQAEAFSKNDLMIQAIVQAEKLEVTDEDYDNTVANYLENSGIESEEELLQNVTEKDIRYSALMQKAYNFIIDNAIVTEVDPTPIPTPAASEE